MDTCAHGAKVGNDLGVPGPVEHTDRDLIRRHPLRLGERLDVVGGTLVQVDDPGRISRATGDLVHIGVRRIQHRALRRPGHHRQRIRHGLGRERRALKRIQRNIDLVLAALADLFPDVQHRRLVTFTLADHDFPIDIQIIQGRAHRINRGLVRLLFVAAPNEFPGGDGGNLGDADRIQHQAAIEVFRTHVASISQIRAMRSSLGRAKTDGRSAIRSIAAFNTDSATAWVVRTMGTPAESATGFCRKLSMDTPASARVSETAAITPGSSLTDRRR